MPGHDIMPRSRVSRIVSSARAQLRVRPRAGFRFDIVPGIDYVLES